MRTITAIAVATGLLVTTAAPAAATHTHVRLTGSGACVLLAANGGEDDVELPHAAGFPDTRQHPLHVNVHLGEAGARKGEPVVWVLGSSGDLANCDGYVNE